jgi:hypothetical protein
MSLLCLASGGLLVALPLTGFTLAWTHSIEKARWEEDWHLSGTTLVVSEARIRGSGAGMEPPPGARFEKGIWHYTPSIPPQQRLRLAHSPYTAGYELCLDGHCQPLADLLPGINDNAVIELSACADR